MMRTLRRLWSRLLASLSLRGSDAELSEELESHIALMAEEEIRRGVPPGEADRNARIRFGSVVSAIESYRDQRGLPMLETVVKDLRYAARSLRKNVGFTATVVLTLALGIGANATIFSVINAALLEPLPYADAARLVALKETRPLAGGTTGQRVSVPVAAA